MQQKINLKALDVNNPDEVGLMYKIRKHPKVDFYLSGNPRSRLFNACHLLT